MGVFHDFGRFFTNGTIWRKTSEIQVQIQFSVNLISHI